MFFLQAKIRKIMERCKEVLHDITVTLPKNSLTALVGPSGSGKSTVMKLCARFYDPQQGRISFGGVPMDEIAPESATTSLCVCRKATTQWLAKEAVLCPEARSSAYPLPVPY